ncbi:MAG TPA: hypothetical protein VK324_09590 [Tepidisphaeraceae bacterium]|nr:hypothetical protein [Tepidisphaeraceae bacterium]
MDAERCLTLHLLRREVLVARDRGRVVIEFSDGAGEATDVRTARLLADELLAVVNLPLLGRHWWEIDRARAAEVVTTALHWDLETGRPAVPGSQAAALAEKILAQFGDRAVYLSNVRATADLTDAPRRWASGHDVDELDAGVAVVSADLAGLLWVEDRPPA